MYIESCELVGNPKGENLSHLYVHFILKDFRIRLCLICLTILWLINLWYCWKSWMTLIDFLTFWSRIVSLFQTSTLLGNQGCWYVILMKSRLLQAAFASLSASSLRGIPEWALILINSTLRWRKEITWKMACHIK